MLALICLLALKPALATPVFQQTGNTLTMSNVDVVLKYNLAAGTTDFYWKNSKKIAAFYSGITFNTGYVKGISYSAWTYMLVGTNEAVITATGAGLPTMKQYFTLDQPDSFLVRVEATGSNLSANWMGPVVVDSASGGILDIGITNDNRALYVPFDNDGFVSYNAMPMNSSSTSYEVGAFYDNTSRNGLVVGSVTHDVWKTEIYFYGANNKLSQMNVFGGATSPWDVMPHGYVSGNTISSPTMFVGFGSDWRATMQDFANENTNFAPRMVWTNSVPFGWNSWGVIQQNINYADAIAVSDFFHTNLEPQGFTNSQGTVYINLDSFWNNLSSFELQSFVNHCHAYGQKAGIYFGPFVWFGSANNATNTYVDGTTNTYSSVLLRDNNGDFESVDGGLAMDPTHPGTLGYIRYYVNMFTNYGFDYIKLDFLSHGALEGIHYDTNVTTGIEAYNEGMSNVISQINGRMFISESIAPLFPYQYGDSRRIACDAETSLIGNTAYTMNSVTYGWWLDNLYPYNDPDIMVFNGYGATTNANQSRLINAAVTGLFLDGDDLTGTNGQQGADYGLTHGAINALTRLGQTFIPADGNTGTSAANLFSSQNGSNWYVAVFNYTTNATNIAVNLTHVGVPAGSYIASDLWSGAALLVSGSWDVSLNAAQSKLFELSPLTTNQASLQWSPNSNDGIWDVDSSANWINVSNRFQTVFNDGDDVLFDDTVDVPTTVNVSDTVEPGLITVNSTTNNFTIQSGTISGPSGLLKEGPSLLTIFCAGGFTGPAVISGGVVYAGNNSFDSVSSITITNNSTLDMGGGTFDNDTPVVVSGGGFNGAGAIYNSYADFPLELLNITLAGDATFGGTARWDLASGSEISGPHNLAIDWSADTNNPYGEWNSVTIGANVLSITLTNGSKLGSKSMDTAFQNPGTMFTVQTNCQLIFWEGGWNGSLHIQGGGIADLWSAPSAFNGSDIVLDDDAQWSCTGGTNDEPVNSAIMLNGVAHFTLSDHNMDYNNIISGPGGFVLDQSDHAVVLSASNTYIGPTIIGSISNSPEVALTGNGSFSQSSLIFFGGNNSTVAHVDVSGRSDQTFTLASGQTLQGVGQINGSLVVSAGAAISPGGTNTTLDITTGSNPVGTLAASGNITLNGMTIIKLDGASNDLVEAAANITYGGTLNLANISGALLAEGNSFQIFSAAAYSGAFTNITPTVPGPGLAWNTNQLDNGVISVAISSSRLAITNVYLSGGNLIFNGSGGTARSTYYVLTSTNLVTPIADWIPIATNQSDANGNFSVTNIINYTNSDQFFIIKQP
jgi:Alpha galactosidase C-terminal beta sandwich domain